MTQCEIRRAVGCGIATVSRAARVLANDDSVIRRVYVRHENNC
ncbi:hypothetical protein EN828_28010 [Mesorhizobium sp. M2D.F.Ca.ET.185.01.1.1]|nr:hypothetical protein EN875_025465 [Mesorhizobium sp. M2D.F.Ca.ET.232.01.1.1]TGP53419.1 hypothetical protein EN869_029175 [Mesorhizobium sp. M2D.F.Ca.ET.226.01.1.1]TGP62306.1 hypothetical protein EN868_28910 [Mesorhizobium sp. M2D.F.Ca.ET.225.01.1.1]TGP74240.1 hypothetical protein EN870_27660 [bacterium M00.F.Ca.ET.227.01.1.1]TGQ25433.1 hypothetical protein EN863_057580 [Mesorhizobium sp. M00.F.Ca.ET.220.01.1.1]TGQ82707.1 hypothetical protein EN849_28705 [Mesorhizobium sp. M2D.F.Ca.ET.206.01